MENLKIPEISSVNNQQFTEQDLRRIFSQPQAQQLQPNNQQGSFSIPQINPIQTQNTLGNPIGQEAFKFVSALLKNRDDKEIDEVVKRGADDLQKVIEQPIEKRKEIVNDKVLGSNLQQVDNSQNRQDEVAQQAQRVTDTITGAANSTNFLNNFEETIGTLYNPANEQFGGSPLDSALIDAGIITEDQGRSIDIETLGILRRQMVLREEANVLLTNQLNKATNTELDNSIARRNSFIANSRGQVGNNLSDINTVDSFNTQAINNINDLNIEAANQRLQNNIQLDALITNVLLKDKELLAQIQRGRFDNKILEDEQRQQRIVDEALKPVNAEKLKAELLGLQWQDESIRNNYISSLIKSVGFIDNDDSKMKVLNLIDPEGVRLSRQFKEDIVQASKSVTKESSSDDVFNDFVNALRVSQNKDG